MDLGTLTEEVLLRCDLLGAISEESGRLTRTFLRPAAHAVQNHMTEWMREAGLSTRVDAVGNVIGRTDAVGRHRGVFVVGSHVDTVPDAGKYDGVLGVLLGIAAAKALNGRQFQRALDVVAFSEEEGIRFRTPYLGSRAVCGTLSDDLLARKDADGLTVTDAIRNYGLRPEEVPSAAYPTGEVVGYFEAHIEQGPVLESRGLSLGVVQAIMGQTRALVRFTGQARHAGTQPMNLRKDALAAAAEFVTAVEWVGRGTPRLRATVGSLSVSPNASNVVPGETRLTVDVRHADDLVRRQAVEQLLITAHAISAERGIGVEIEVGLEQSAIACEVGMSDRLASAMQAEGFSPEQVVSGAGHDAVIMADLCPMAMLFIRSPGGISHHPDESVRREDVRAALGVMVRFLANELDAE
jgi:allantoate deiminase